MLYNCIWTSKCQSFTLSLWKNRKKWKTRNNENYLHNTSISFSDKLKRVEFSNNSEIKYICNYAFSHSIIEFLYIPSSIVNLNYSLFKTPNLNNVKIIPCNERNIMSLNDQIIIGKSDIKRFKCFLILKKLVQTLLMNANNLSKSLLLMIHN